MTGRRQLRRIEDIARALARGAPLRLLLHAAELSAEAAAVVETAAASGVSVRGASPRELERWTAGPEVGELLALLGPPPEASLESALERGGAGWWLVDPAYPSNAGSVVRSAEVSGAAYVLVSGLPDHRARRACARASMRADRLMPLLFESSGDILAAVARAGLPLIAIEDSGERAPWEVDLRPPALFCVGGEQAGLPPAIVQRAAHVLRIPMAGFIPSYNLQAAAAMVMAERLRQLAGA